MTGEFRDDPRAPVFFLSYARARRMRQPVSGPTQVNQHVLRLYEDLTFYVNELVALPAGRDPGFMDMTMDGGERWRRRVLRAAGTCQVFVCLLSTPYLTRSEWCAMEWDTFSRRKIVRRDRQPTDETGIIPVLWAPIEEEIPPVVADVTRFQPPGLPDPLFLPMYEENGLFGLLTMKQENPYQAIVWKLAQHIQRLYSSHWVEPRVPAGTDRLRTSFVAGSRA